MDFSHSDKVKELLARVTAFMDEHVYPNEKTYADQMTAFGADRWQVPQIVEDLKVKAREAGLWNLFLPESDRGAGLSNLEYSALCEVMGRSGFASEVFNCAAPDTGNMEVLERYGNERHKREYLQPLLDGKIRSAFLMTEPDVASSDATNIETSIVREGDEYVINGRKWWSSGVGDPRCKIAIVMGKTDPDAETYRQQSQILMPLDTPGIEIIDIDHVGLRYARTCDVVFDNVEIDAEHILGGIEGWNKGWNMLASEALDVEKLEISSVALGIAHAAMDEAWEYAQQRRQFGKPISAHQSVRHDLVEARTKLQACDHMLYHAAHLAQNREPCSVETSMAKLFIGDTTLEIVLKCQQVMGAYGCTSEYAMERHVRDILVMPIVGGSSKIQKNNIAARLRLSQ